MSLSRDTRNEKRMKAALRAQFRLKQTFERIDWEYDVLIPKLDEFKARAQMPELPEDLTIEIEEDEAQDTE